MTSANGKIRPSVTAAPSSSEPLQRLRLIEHFLRSLRSGWPLEKCLRLALRTVMAGVAECSGVQASLLDGVLGKIVVVEAIGRQARGLKSCTFDLADLPELQAVVLGKGKGSATDLLISTWPAKLAPLGADGTRFCAAPLIIEGRAVGLLAVTQSDGASLSDDEAMFLQVVAGLVAEAIAKDRLWAEMVEQPRAIALFDRFDQHAPQRLPLIGLLCDLARAAREITRSAGAAIAASAADGQSQIRLVACGEGALVHRKGQRPMNTGLSGWVVEHRQAAFTNDMVSDVRADLKWTLQTGVRSAVALPLLVSGKVIGCLSVYNRSARDPYGTTDIGLLNHLASHAAVALENASLSDRYRHSALARTLIWQMLRDRRRGLGQIAVEEERARIARDLHDGLAQDLSNLGIRLQLLQRLMTHVTDPSLDALMGELATVRQVARSMNDQLRAAIGALRGQTGTDDDFSMALANLAEAAGLASGIAVTAELGAAGVKLPPLIASRLLEIAHEAINNALRHADARHVWVRLIRGDRRLELSIRDDGRGFRCMLTKVSDKHFGLRMMQERAHEIGATVEIASQRDGGTRVDVLLPLVG